MTQKYYKVCSIQDGRYYSYLANALGPEYTCEYTLNRVTKPTKGLLFVFNTLADLLNDVGVSYINYKIFEVEADVPNFKRPEFFAYPGSREALDKFWDGEELEKKDNWSIPNGTSFAKSIKPIKVVTKAEIEQCIKGL